MMTQCPVSSGFSCHTIDNFLEKDDIESSSATNLKFSHPSWIHVFLKTSSALCTAAIHFDVSLPKVLHQRLRHAKKKQWKIEKLLHEVNVPPNQFKLTHDEIDSEIIIFDGGDSTTPQIKPLDGILWHCIFVTFFHVEDEHRPNLGLCFPKIDGVYPFI